MLYYCFIFFKIQQKKKNAYIQEIGISYKENLRVLAKCWPLSSSRGTQCVNTNVLIILTERLASPGSLGGSWNVTQVSVSKGKICLGLSFLALWVFAKQIVFAPCFFCEDKPA